ncbi:hypothetical protein [Leptospira sp. GIMC2001]|uniref:hypothetical protein n=1 Tax=Leptospira sp. GIMC2001 TaxID=1513297 RepID=UPI00234AF7E8|nr:hypothetical protein [Leptospira sp. GIMC2001]WCL50387.1 hypothetical protein O4O04_06095 [Leptospira sp. GIMC2001]
MKIQNFALPKIPVQAQSKPSYYALPGFCDAYVTLGVNPWGDQASVDSLKLALQSFVSHGFTNVMSVADGKWVEKAKSNVDKSLWKGPNLHLSRQPIVPESEESIPDGLYKIIRSDEDMRSYLQAKTSFKTHIFQRDLGGYIPDIRFLYKLKTENKIGDDWIIHTFADPLSTQEAIATGWDAIYHPINGDFTSVQLRKVKWSPLMSVYYYQSSLSQKSWAHEYSEYKKISPFFKVHYSEVSKEISESLIQSDEKNIQAKKEFETYRTQFLSREFMKNNLIFGSGAGHPLVYPGAGAYREIKIWEDVFRSWDKNTLNSESEGGNESSDGKKSGFMDSLRRLFGLEKSVETIAIPKKDSGKIPDHRKYYLKAITENTCRFLQAGHLGKIGEGLEANLILYERNPLSDSEGIMKPSVVYVQGRSHSVQK